LGQKRKEGKFCLNAKKKEVSGNWEGSPWINAVGIVAMGKGHYTTIEEGPTTLREFQATSVLSSRGIEVDKPPVGGEATTDTV